VVAEAVSDQVHDPDLDQQPDEVQRQEDQRLLGHMVIADPVPVGPELVADEGDDRGEAVGQDHGGRGAKAQPEAQQVSRAHLYHEADAAHDAELRDLVQQ
jgi:hypothetical protein